MNPIRWLRAALIALIGSFLDVFDATERPAFNGTLDDFTDDPEYQKFAAKCAEKCTCSDAPCDSCLSGGICDDEQDYLTEH